MSDNPYCKHGTLPKSCWICSVIELEAENAKLKADNKAIRKAAKASMKGCTRCWGKVKYSGKDFEPCVCKYCEALTAALQEPVE